MKIPLKDSGANIAIVPLIISLVIHSFGLLVLSFLFLSHPEFKDRDYIIINDIITEPIEPQLTNITPKPLLPSQQNLEQTTIIGKTNSSNSFNPQLDSLKTILSLFAYVNMLNDKSPLHTFGGPKILKLGPLLYAKGLIDSCTQHSLTIKDQIQLGREIIKQQLGMFYKMTKYNSSISRHPVIPNNLQQQTKQFEIRIPLSGILDLFK